METQLYEYPKIQQDHDLASYFIMEQNDEALIRAQVQVDEIRFAFLWRNNVKDSWCGYAMIREVDWHLNELRIRSIAYPEVTYAGPSIEPICWMRYNPTTQHYSEPIEPLYALGEDRIAIMWVGFKSASIDYHAALTELYGFENTVFRIANGDLTVTE